MGNVLFAKPMEIEDDDVSQTSIESIESTSISGDNEIEVLEDEEQVDKIIKAEENEPDDEEEQGEPEEENEPDDEEEQDEPEEEDEPDDEDEPEEEQGDEIIEEKGEPDDEEEQENKDEPEEEQGDEEDEGEENEEQGDEEGQKIDDFFDACENIYTFINFLHTMESEELKHFINRDMVNVFDIHFGTPLTSLIDPYGFKNITDAIELKERLKMIQYIMEYKFLDLTVKSSIEDRVTDMTFQESIEYLYKITNDEEYRMFLQEITTMFI